MAKIEGVFFSDKGIVVLDKELLNSKPEPTCLCKKFFDLQDENERLRAELKKCEFVYFKEKAYQDMIRMLREKVLILESQNRVYASILEKGDKHDKRT